MWLLQLLTRQSGVLAACYTKVRIDKGLEATSDSAP